MTRDAGTRLAPPNSAEIIDIRTSLALLEFAPDVLLLVDVDGHVTYANSRVRDVFHYEPAELLGQPIDLLLPEGVGGTQADVAVRSHYVTSPLQVYTMSEGRAFVARRKNGEHFPAEVTARPLSHELQQWTSIAIRDATRLVAFQRQHTGQQRAEAIGRLSGAVAHSFHEIFSSVVSLTDAAFQAARPGSTMRASLEDVLSEAERGRALTRKLLDIAKRRPIEPVVVDINAVVRGSERMIDGLLENNVQVVRALSPDAGLVRVDQAGIEQVLANLCTNAADAMPNGGTLRIETGCITLSKDQVSSVSPDSAPGAYVLLRIIDTGTGMSEEVRRHAFEPFYSTKTAGPSCGLGLATSYGLVAQVGGFMTLTSHPQQGTQVDVYLPRIAALPTTVSESGRRGTVLIVEADHAVRAIAARELGLAGYLPITASGWLDALDAVRDQSAQVDVLVVDLGIPATDGFELANRIRRLCPAVRVMFMSQHDIGTLIAKGARLREEELLQKPFGTAELLTKIAQLTAPMSSDR